MNYQELQAFLTDEINIIIQHETETFADTSNGFQYMGTEKTIYLDTPESKQLKTKLFYLEELLKLVCEKAKEVEQC